jgi:endonuclease III
VAGAEDPFVAFTGIGQKNAAMAVEILERDLGVAVANLHRSDIVYDVHVRRVFLLTRLADRDERDHMIAVARQLYPARPSALDVPAWLVGRRWCHPRSIRLRHVSVDPGLRPRLRRT